MQVDTLPEAKKIAKKTSQNEGYACIICSNAKYYVETQTPFIRTWEILICEYIDGIIQKTDWTENEEDL